MTATLLLVLAVWVFAGSVVALMVAATLADPATAERRNQRGSTAAAVGWLVVACASTFTAGWSLWQHQYDGWLAAKTLGAAAAAALGLAAMERPT